MLETENVQTLTNRDEYNEYVNERLRNNEPALCVNKVNTRTWACVECDFIEASCGEIAEPDGVDEQVELRGQLTEKAIADINEILSEYESAEQRQNGSTLSINYGASYFQTPEFRLDVAEEIASRLADVMVDADNWERKNCRANDLLTS